MSIHNNASVVACSKDEVISFIGDYFGLFEILGDIIADVMIGSN